MNVHSVADLKKVNLKNVFDSIYNDGCTSKTLIAKKTGMSIPTVSTNIKKLMNMHLVKDSGEQQSTGGRRAQSFSINPNARISIGVELLKDSYRIVAVDLVCNIIAERVQQFTFYDDENYYKKISEIINEFAESVASKKKILGVAITVQGLISNDGNNVVYSPILQAKDITKESFQKYIDYPCVLLHDTEASAFAETWKNSKTENAIYLVLNYNFGGTVIFNGENSSLQRLAGATIEHMCLNPKGPACYCGKTGCAEVYCSASKLVESSNCTLSELFDSIRNNNSKNCKLWNNYLKNLAKIINNIRMVIDCDVILGGLLTDYINEEDINLLLKFVQEECFFNKNEINIRKNRFGSKSPAMGAAITVIDLFIKSL